MSTLDTANTLGDLLRTHAEQRPTKVAFTTPQGGQLTFGDFNARVNRLCNALADLGIKKGSRVAILAHNRPEYVEIFGLSKSGIIIVPINWRLAGPELIKLLEHSAPEVLIVDSEHLPLVDRLRTQLPGIRHFVTLTNASAGWTPYESLIDSASDDEPANQATADDVLCIVYTSGTTGDPKGVKLTHRGLLANCRTASTEMLELTEHDRTLAVLPLFHVGGMWYHLFPSFAAGCTTLVLSTFEPAVLLHELERQRITNVHLVPTMISALLNHPHADKTDLSHLRLIFYAASSIPAELLRRAMLRFAGCRFAQGYGSTEAGIVSILTPADHMQAENADDIHLLSSCGHPALQRDVRIVDEHLNIVAPRDIGEIEVRSPAIMSGYWHDDEATQRALTDGWLKTGDLGYLDNEGYLYIVDRKNDMVITGGENVYPTEVEACFYHDPDILEAAVFGIPDPQWVEKLVAAVVLRPNALVSQEDLIQRLRQHLAPYKCPKKIFFIAELPKNGAGKVLRKNLRQRYTTKGMP